MSYAVTKTYFDRRLASFELKESKTGLNFENESENIDKRYTIESPTMDNPNDTLATRFFPERTIVVRLAYKLSESGSVFEYTTAHTKLENIIRDLHSVSNYRTDGIRRIVFASLKVSNQKEYIMAEISFTVEESLDYV